MGKKLQRKKILVTGGAGFIGSHICDALVSSGYDVFALSRGRNDMTNYFNNRMEYKVVKGYLMDLKGLVSILKRVKPQSVLHLAALIPSPEVSSPLSFFDVNVLGTFNLLEACRILGIKNVIYSSSMSVYGDVHRATLKIPVLEKHPIYPYDFYGLSKFIGEEYCRLYSQNYGFHIIVLRYSGVYGAGKESGAVSIFTKNALSGKSIKIKNDMSWDIVSVKDVALANIIALSKINKIYFEIFNIGSGKETHIKALAEEIIKLTKSKSRIVFSKDFKSTPKSRFYFNISKANKILGFKPNSVKDRLSEYIKEMTIYAKK